MLLDDGKRSRLSLDASAAGIKTEMKDPYSTVSAADPMSKKLDPFAPMSLTAAAGLSFPFDFSGVMPPVPSHLRYAEAFARYEVSCSVQTLGISICTKKTLYYVSWLV